MKTSETTKVWRCSARTRTLIVFAVLVSLVPLTSSVSASSRCHPIFRDDRGDAYEDATGLDLRLINDPTLDILTGDITYVTKSKSLLFSITVDDLTDEPPLASDGKGFDFFFYYGDSHYFVRAWSHDVPLNQGYSLHTGDDQQLLKDGLKGAFDTQKNRVVVVLPLSVFNSAARPAKKLSPGRELWPTSIRAYRSLIVTASVSDDAYGECAYVVGR